MPPRVPLGLFLSRFAPGQVEPEAVDLISRIDRKLFAVHVACFRCEGGGDRLPRAGAPVDTLAEFTAQGQVQRLGAARQCARWCRDHDIAVVHTLDAGANVFGLPAAAFAGVPVRIGTRPARRARSTPALAALERAALRCAHAVVARSRTGATELQNARIPADRVRVVPPAVDLRPCGDRSDTPIRRIAVIGEPGPESGHDVLFEAAAMVVRRCPDAQFLIAGEGPSRADLERAVDTPGLSQAVRFLGAPTDVRALLASSDLFVHPSRAGAFEPIVLEAMATGLPIVATRVTGALEVLDNQRTAVLVAPGDPRALGFAILDLIHWRSHAAALGRAARRAAETRYSWERVTAAFEALYLEQLAAHAPLRHVSREAMAS